MKRFLSITLVALMVASICAFAGCSGSNSGSTTSQAADKKTDKTYVIYSDNAFAPFEYLDTKTKKYVGVDMDIMDAVAKDQGFKYDMHNEGFDASMGAVQSGQADGMIAGMTINDERKKTFDFSKPYFEDGQVIVAKKGTKIEDLKGKSVAVKNGTAGKDYAESVKDKYGFSINYYKDSPSMYQAVKTGVDIACFEDFSVIAYSIKTGEVKLEMVNDKPFNVKGYGFAVKKGQNSELLEKFDAGLANIKKSGELKKILAKYGY
jgi:polar amino acid transport system substrate-binding protein